MLAANYSNIEAVNYIIKAHANVNSLDNVRTVKPLIITIHLNTKIIFSVVVHH